MNLDLLASQTCLTFEQVYAEDPDGVMRFYKGSGCSSTLGRGAGGSKINIGTSCTQDGTIQHEVMHSLGFHHEQNRPDRDDFVVVHDENIAEGKEGNFNKINSDKWVDQDVEYDIGSVLQYSGTAYSTNGKPTITYIENGLDSGKIIDAQRVMASSLDIWQICKIYKCDQCNGERIASYGGDAHKRYLGKCSDAFPRYFWKSRCFDGWSECENGDDEDENEKQCEGQTPKPITTISPSLCGRVTVSGNDVAMVEKYGGVYDRVGYTDYEGTPWPYFHNFETDMFIYISGGGKWHFSNDITKGAHLWTYRRRAMIGNGKCPAAEEEWYLWSNKRWMRKSPTQFSVTSTFISTTSTTTTTTKTTTTTRTTTTTTTRTTTTTTTTRTPTSTLSTTISPGMYYIYIELSFI